MKVKLQNVRLAFPRLFKAEQVNGQGEAKFRATFLIPKTDTKQIKEIENAIKQVATEKWGVKADAIINSIRGNAMRFMFRDGDQDKPDVDGYQGCMFLNASNLVRPFIADRDTTPLAEEDGRPYAGCYVNAVIDIFGYDKQGKGISASLSGVQFYKDGDAFAGGGVASPADFDDLSVNDDSNMDLVG